MWRCTTTPTTPSTSKTTCTTTATREAWARERCSAPRISTWESITAARMPMSSSSLVRRLSCGWAARRTKRRSPTSTRRTEPTSSRARTSSARRMRASIPRTSAGTSSAKTATLSWWAPGRTRTATRFPRAIPTSRASSTPIPAPAASASTTGLRRRPPARFPLTRFLHSAQTQAISRRKSRRRPQPATGSLR